MSTPARRAGRPLYDHMLRLLREAPDGGPPLGGHPVPHRDGGRPRPHGGIPAAVAEALTPLPGGVEELRERYTRVGPLDRFGHLIHTAVTGRGADLGSGLGTART